MAIKFSLPKKKAKNQTENLNVLDSLDSPAPKPKKSLFAKRSPKTNTLTEDSPVSTTKKLDKKSMTLIGALVAILLIGVAVVMFVLPMLSEPEQTPEPTPTASEPVATTSAAPEIEATASTPAASTASATGDVPPAETVTQEPPAPVMDAQPEPTAPEAPPKTEEEKPAVAQKLMEEPKNKKPAKADVSVKEQGNTMSYADFVKAAEQQVFADR